MNLRNQKFVNAFLKTGNGTQAAKDAGYSEKSAHAQGCRLLKDAEVSAAIAKRSETAAMSADEVLLAVAVLARGAGRESDKLTALGMLGKHHRLFTDRLEHEAGKSFADLVLNAQRIREGKA